MAEETNSLTADEAKQIKTIGTSDKMSDDQTQMRPLVYPISDTNRYGAKVTFIPQLITGPKLDGDVAIGDVLTTFRKGLTSVIKPEDVDPKKKKPNADNEDSGTQENNPDDANGEDGNRLKVSSTEPLPLTMKKIAVYLPIAFGSTDTFTYDSPSIGSAGALLSNSLEKANGNAGDILGNALGDFINLFKGAGQTGATGLGKLGIAKLAKRGPTEVGDGAAAALRVTADPNIRTLFRGVAVRQFAFQFKFIAKNAKEAQEIKSIIKRFRFYAYPESIGFAGKSVEDGGNGSFISVGYKYPHPFIIKTEFVDENENVFEIGPKIKSCYLTSITTNFNPSSMAFHRDGEPVEIDLSLNFTEETTLNKQDILAGF